MPPVESDFLRSPRQTARFQGHRVRSGPVDLETLRLWLGKLLKLQTAPTVVECAEGKVLLAGLHRVKSTAPLVSKSYAELLTASQTTDETFDRLKRELHQANLPIDQDLLKSVSRGEPDAVEDLLLVIYQHYAFNHSQKFNLSGHSLLCGSEPSLPTKSTKKSPADIRSSDIRTAIGCEIDSNCQENSMHHSQQPKRTPAVDSCEEAMCQLGSIESPGLVLFSARSHLPELDGSRLRPKPEENKGDAWLSAHLGGRSDRQSGLAFTEFGSMVDESYESGPGSGLAMNNSAQTSPDRSVLSACSDIDQSVREVQQGQLSQARRCLAAWLGCVAGWRSAIGRALLSASSQATKFNMLASGAAHRAAVTSLLGLASGSSNLPSRASVNVAFVLRAMEDAGFSSDLPMGDLKYLPGGSDRLSEECQLQLGEAVAELAIVRRQDGLEAVDLPARCVELLRWADALLVGAASSHVCAQLAPPPGGCIQDAHWAGVDWASVQSIVAKSFPSHELSREILLGKQDPDGIACPYHHVDAICCAHGISLPFQAEDLPVGLQSSRAMQLILLAFLDEVRSHRGDPLEPPTNPAAETSDGSQGAIARGAGAGGCPGGLPPSSPDGRLLSSRGPPAQLPADAYPDEPAEGAHFDESCQSKRPGFGNESIVYQEPPEHELADLKSCGGDIPDKAPIGSPGPWHDGTLPPRDFGQAEAATAQSMKPMDGSGSAKSLCPTSEDPITNVADPTAPRDETASNPAADQLSAAPPGARQAPGWSSLDQLGAINATPRAMPLRPSSANGSVGTKRHGAGPASWRHRHSALRESLVPVDMFAPPPLAATPQPTPCQRPFQDTEGFGSLETPNRRPQDTLPSAQGSAGTCRSNFLPCDIFALPKQDLGERRTACCRSATAVETNRVVESSGGIGRYRTDDTRGFRSSAGGLSDPSDLRGGHDGDSSSTAQHGSALPMSAPFPSLPNEGENIEGENSLDLSSVATGSPSLKSSFHSFEAGNQLSWQVPVCSTKAESTTSVEEIPQTAAAGLAVADQPGGRVAVPLGATEDMPSAQVAPASHVDGTPGESSILASAIRSALEEPVQTSSAEQGNKVPGASAPDQPADPIALSTEKAQAPTSRQPGPLPDPELFEVTLQRGIASGMVAAAEQQPNRQDGELSGGKPPDSPTGAAERADGPLSSASGVVQSRIPRSPSPGRAPLEEAGSREIERSPGILSGGQTLIPGLGGECAPGGAGLQRGAHDVAPAQRDLAFDVSPGLNSAGEDKDEERRARVQAMLDAKRERFLAQRKHREQATAQKAAKEESQRKAMAKLRDGESANTTAFPALRSAREAALPAAGGCGSQTELQQKPASPRRRRTKEEVLAQAAMPLDEHIASLVAERDDGALSVRKEAQAHVGSEANDGKEGGECPAAGVADGHQNCAAGVRQTARSRAPGGQEPQGLNTPRQLVPPTFTRASNRKLIRNALCHVCLAGSARLREKEAVLKALDSRKGDDSFVVLFKTSTLPLHFRGLYVHERRTGRVFRIYGRGPEEIGASQVVTFFKYDCGSREFKVMQTSEFTFGITCGIARV